MYDVDFILSQVILANGTFSFKLRDDRVWDEALFKKLTSAMYRVAQSHEHKESVIRALAYVFSFFSTSFPIWLEKEHVAKRYSEQYYS